MEREKRKKRRRRRRRIKQEAGIGTDLAWCVLRAGQITYIRTVQAMKLSNMNSYNYENHKHSLRVYMKRMPYWLMHIETGLSVMGVVPCMDRSQHHWSYMDHSQYHWPCMDHSQHPWSFTDHSQHPWMHPLAKSAEPPHLLAVGGIDTPKHSASHQGVSESLFYFYLTQQGQHRAKWKALPYKRRLSYQVFAVNQSWAQNFS